MLVRMFIIAPLLSPSVAVMTDNAFKARDIGLRAQKKILSRMATKNIVKTFIDGTTASLLDNVYRLAKLHVRESKQICSHSEGTRWQFVSRLLTLFSFIQMSVQCGNKKEAEKLVKNIIKIVIKIGVLHRNNQFNAEETKAAERFQQKFLVCGLCFQITLPFDACLIKSHPVPTLSTNADNPNGGHIIP